MKLGLRPPNSSNSSNSSRALYGDEVGEGPRLEWGWPGALGLPLGGVEMSLGEGARRGFGVIYVALPPEEWGGEMWSPRVCVCERRYSGRGWHISTAWESGP